MCEIMVGSKFAPSKVPTGAVIGWGSVGEYKLCRGWGNKISTKHIGSNYCHGICVAQMGYGEKCGSCQQVDVKQGERRKRRKRMRQGPWIFLSWKFSAKNFWLSLIENAAKVLLATVSKALSFNVSFPSSVFAPTKNSAFLIYHSDS